MQLAVVILFVLMTVFLCLYVSKSLDYKKIEEENRELIVGYSRDSDKLSEYEKLQEENCRLNAENAMEAIRYNGYVPEVDGNWITFMAQGERYIIDSDRFPVMVMMKHYSLDSQAWDMDLMHKAAHRVSDDIIIGKVLFTDDEDSIIFQVTAIENRYGHFKDCLTRYISIIESSQSRMDQLYNEMVDAKQKDSLAEFPQLGAGAYGDKKVMS